MSRRRARGFTLIELLVVLVILGVLSAILYPMLFSQKTQAEAREVEALMLSLKQAALSYASEKGDYPPDRLADVDPRFGAGGNQENEGIEAFVAALALSGIPGNLDLLDELQGKNGLANTDQDRAGHPLGRLGTTEKLEVHDRWGQPVAYFHHRSYGRAQTMRMAPGGDLQQAVAVRDPRSGGYMEPRRFQLISAGPDGTFGTGDDVANFEPPERP